MSPRSALVALAVLSTGCGEDSGPAVDGSARSAARSPAPGAVLTHDFGTIPHGETRTVELSVPLPDTDLGWAPVRLLKTCSCARHEFVIRGAGGDRIADERPTTLVGADEELFLRLSVHTADKEAADLPETENHAQVVLQEAGTNRRVNVPVRFTFAIDAPLTWKPYAHLDLGRIARPVEWLQTFEVHHDGHAVTFGEPIGVEPDPAHPGEVRPTSELTARLEPGGADMTLVHLRFAAAEERPLGPFVAQLRIPTDLPSDYELRLGVSGELIGDYETSPPGSFSFGAFDFGTPRSQTLVVTDHDPRRPPGFVVEGVVDTAGNDLGEHFTVEIAEVPGRIRSRHVIVHYLGKLDARSFRGVVRLAKSEDQPPVLEIELVGFHRPDPNR